MANSRLIVQMPSRGEIALLLGATVVTLGLGDRICKALKAYHWSQSCHLLLQIGDLLFETGLFQHLYLQIGHFHEDASNSWSDRACHGLIEDPLVVQKPCQCFRIGGYAFLAVRPTSGCDGRPLSGHTFLNWQGCTTMSTNTCTVTVPQAVLEWSRRSNKAAWNLAWAGEQAGRPQQR
jgi:hypothetical protein